MMRSSKIQLTLVLFVFGLGQLIFVRAQTPLVFNVMSYGATGNGSTLDSPAINAAIAAAGAAGGGTVAFPAGNYFCGSLHLTNNITFYLSNNAVILGSKTNIDPVEMNVYSNYQDYGHSYFHDALIWGENLTNLTFTGTGKITGNGNLTVNTPVPGQGDKDLCLVECTNVIINGITLTEGGHFGILADGCSNLLVSGAQILESSSRDAFNLIDSSGVVVTNCNIQGSDDGMVIKSDYALGLVIGGRDIHVLNSSILSTENNALQIGSETVGNFSDISWANIRIGSAGKAGIGIVTEDGSVIDGVTYDNITMTNCACPIFLKLCFRTGGSPNPMVGRIRNISFNQVTAVNSADYGHTNTATIDGFSSTTNIAVENVTFNGVNLSVPGGEPVTTITNQPVENNSDYVPNDMGLRPSYGWYIRYANNLGFTNCQVHFDTNDDRPAIIVDTVTNILFSSFHADVGQNDTNYDLGFSTTANYEATNGLATTNAPAPGAGLRIYASNATPALVAAAPYFNPGDGLSAIPQSVVITADTPGATIRYTTDGTTPTATNGTIYFGPVTVAGETVLRAVAYASGLTSSAVNTAIYTPGSSLSLPLPPPTTVFSFETVLLPYVTNGAIAVVQTDANEPGGEWLALEGTGVGQSIQYAIPSLPAGTYDLSMYWKGNGDRGMLDFTLDGVMLGSALDQYASGETYPVQDYGDVTFATNGTHTIRLTVAGRNAASSGYWLSAAEFLFTLVQPPPPVFDRTLTYIDGRLQLTGSGYPTLSYRLQVSTNLSATNWVTIGTVTADSTGAFAFTDLNSVGQAVRFIAWSRRETKLKGPD